MKVLLYGYVMYMYVFTENCERELMLSTLVPFQSTSLRKTLLAHIVFIRFLFRVRTHVIFQSIRMTKLHLAHITLVRFLVRVNTHVDFQMTRLTKTLLAHHIRTVSPSCEYACGLSNYQNNEKRFSHISHSYGFSFV